MKSVVHDNGKIKSVHHGRAIDSLPNSSVVQIKDSDFPDDFDTSSYIIDDGKLVQP